MHDVMLMQKEKQTKSNLGKNPSEARQAWRASPGLEGLVLSKKNSKGVVGPGRPARGTLVSTVPTVAPRPTMGTPKSSMEAKRRGPKEACLGRDTWDAAVAPEATTSSVPTGDPLGPATSSVPER